MASLSNLFTAACLLAGPALAQNVLGADSQNYETLKAIPSWDYDPSAPQASESEIDITQLDPSPSEMFLWGGPRNHRGRFPYANMTMFTEPSERILSMEKFSPMLESVQCEDGSMTLAFKSDDSFLHVRKSWNWVNEKPSHTYIMMANHASCGEEERQPYHITDIDYDEKNKIAYLYGDQKSFQEVAHTFDLDFGTADAPGQANRHLAPRWDTGFDIDTEWEYSGMVVNDEGDDGGNEHLALAIECISCGTTGKISVEGHVSWSLFELDEISFTFSPSEVGGFADVKMDINATSTLVAYWGVPIAETPAWGFNIPLVGKIGLSAGLQFGVSFGSITGAGSISSGAGFKLPADASAEVIVYEDPSANSTGDWTPETYSRPLNVTGELGMSGSAYLQIMPSIGFEVFDFGISAGPTFKPINFGLEITATTECPETGNPGLSIVRKLGAAFGAFVGTPPSGGIAIEGPDPISKRDIGLGLYWVFWKGVWETWEHCTGDGPAESEGRFPRWS